MSRIFFRLLSYNIILHLLFLVFFPFTGLGRILYLPASFSIWLILALLTGFLAKKYQKGRLPYFEITYAILLFLVLGLTFVQDSNISPFQQLLNGNIPDLNNVKKGFEWLI